MATSTNNSDGAFDTEEELGNEDNTSTFEQEVNAVVSKMELGEDGLWQLPKDLDVSKEAAFAAKIEKRRRDTQSAAAKTAQQLEASIERSSKLESKLKENFVTSLTKDQQEELEDLRSSDPDAYRNKFNEYEAAALEAFEEELADMGYNEEEVAELADRNSMLTEFLEDNPGLTLNDEVFENDLPPRLVKQLSEGEISFKEFLGEAKVFLTGSTTIDKGDEADDEPNLGKAGGGSEASEKALAGDNDTSYKNVVF